MKFNNNLKFNKTTTSFVLMCFFMLMLGSKNSVAQSVQPMVFELEPSGSKSTQSLRIENPNSGPMTVEIVPLKIIIDEHGKETNVLAEDDFLIYPPQTIIKPSAAQTVKVKYIGDPSIKVSQAYRISVNQLPVDLSSNGSGVSILTKFLTIANVSPIKSRPNLKVTNVAEVDSKNWLVTVENTGNRFGSLSSTSWEFESRDQLINSKVLSVNEVNQFVQQTLVPPKSKLLISLPRIEGFKAESTTITLVKES